MVPVVEPLVLPEVEPGVLPVPRLRRLRREPVVSLPLRPDVELPEVLILPEVEL